MQMLGMSIEYEHINSCAWMRSDGEHVHGHGRISELIINMSTMSATMSATSQPPYLTC